MTIHNIILLTSLVSLFCLSAWMSTKLHEVLHQHKLRRREWASLRLWARAQMDKGNWQDAVNQTLAEDIRSLKVYRKHHAERLAELEDLVDLLNEEALAGLVDLLNEEAAFDLESTQDLPILSASAAQPERSVGVRSDQQELDFDLSRHETLEQRVGEKAAADYRRFMEIAERLPHMRNREIKIELGTKDELVDWMQNE